MNYNDVIQLWGRKVLRDNNIVVEDTEQVSVDLTTYDEGYCETCSYTYGVVEVYCRNGSVQIRNYGFTEILNELISLSAENAENITSS